MPNASRSEIETIARHLEELWGAFDALFAVCDQIGWGGKHGQDWTFAEVPYHVMYCDREAVIKAVEFGANIPPAEKRDLKTLRELNGWNASEFAKRPAGQTPGTTVAEYRASHDDVRRLLNGLSDADLDRKTWFQHGPQRGWRTARWHLRWCRMHTWMEFVGLRAYMKREAPTVGPETTHASLATLMAIFSGFLDRAGIASLTRPFIFVLDFTGPASDAWTFSIADGKAAGAHTRAPQPDFVMRLSPENFVKIYAGALNPMFGILTGQIKAQGWGNFSTFGKLAPLPKLDMEWEILEGLA